VYISCNPATQVRDLQEFQELGYEFDEISPVDMFPQTPHVESVTVLERTEK
jgi:23S rRNA (uracil1939-C5)-methyltransferase